MLRRKPMASLYIACGVAQLLLGTIHNFIYGPMNRIALRGPSLWFYAGGGALWYAGAITVLAALSGSQNGGLALASVLVNLSLLIFTLIFALDERRNAIPQITILTLTAGGALILAIRDLIALRI